MSSNALLVITADHKELKRAASEESVEPLPPPQAPPSPRPPSARRPRHRSTLAPAPAPAPAAAPAPAHHSELSFVDCFARLQQQQRQRCLRGAATDADEDSPASLSESSGKSDITMVATSTTSEARSYARSYARRPGPEPPLEVIMPSVSASKFINSSASYISTADENSSGLTDEQEAEAEEDENDPCVQSFNQLSEALQALSKRISCLKRLSVPRLMQQQRLAGSKRTRAERGSPRQELRDLHKGQPVYAWAEAQAEVQEAGEAEGEGEGAGAATRRHLASAGQYLHRSAGGFTLFRSTYALHTLEPLSIKNFVFQTRDEQRRLLEKLFPMHIGRGFFQVPRCFTEYEVEWEGLEGEQEALAGQMTLHKAQETVIQVPFVDSVLPAIPAFQEPLASSSSPSVASEEESASPTGSVTPPSEEETSFKTLDGDAPSAELVCLRSVRDVTDGDSGGQAEASSEGEPPPEGWDFADTYFLPQKGHSRESSDTDSVTGSSDLLLEDTVEAALFVEAATPPPSAPTSAAPSACLHAPLPVSARRALGALSDAIDDSDSDLGEHKHDLAPLWPRHFVVNSSIILLSVSVWSLLNSYLTNDT